MKEEKAILSLDGEAASSARVQHAAAERGRVERAINRATEPELERKRLLAQLLTDAGLTRLSIPDDQVRTPF